MDPKFSTLLKTRSKKQDQHLQAPLHLFREPLAPHRRISSAYQPILQKLEVVDYEQGNSARMQHA